MASSDITASENKGDGRHTAVVCGFLTAMHSRDIDTYVYCARLPGLCGCPGSRERESNPLDLEAIVSCPVWVLGTEPGTSARTESARNHQALSPILHSRLVIEGSLITLVNPGSQLCECLNGCGWWPLSNL